MKKLKPLLIIALLATIAPFFFGSCSSDDNPAPDGKNKVTYRIVGSSDVNITTVVFYDGSSSPVTRSGDFGATWESDEVTVESSRTIISANGIGATDASTLKAEIWIDGKLAKENTVSIGKVLSTTLSLN
ncbi:tudor domain-containing protein [Sphingobacterium hungaricum]|uniref:Uncharacterized protein n=1 Tax=Sphingobacterium hungaricum TaxID=2082723 RepID=A0A928UW06_9SPHI|nr:hypothetical protein [Sphingobacterium hungaricum]MBE8714346.1 hypothetical protein [Sphingobacterium hungaricum]